MLLKGEIAFITGAAQGIGAGIAEALAKEGASVVISDVDFELAEQTASNLAKLGVQSLAVKTNVADYNDVQNSVEQVIKAMGKISILVNNAGITRDSLLVRMKKEDWDAVLGVNLSGVFNATRIISPLMMKQREGKIINIASIVGEMGNAGQANYAASKAGVIALTKTTARELASRGVTCNAIAPGFIETAMTQNLSEEVKNLKLSQIPMKMFGQVEDVAAAVVFLSSKNAKYITGQVINVNGGMLMNT